MPKQPDDLQFENDTLKKEIAELKLKLVRLRKRDIEIEKLSERHEQEIDDLEDEHEKKFEKMEARHEREIEKMTARHEHELKELELKHDREIERIESKYAVYEEDSDIVDEDVEDNDEE